MRPRAPEQHRKALEIYSEIVSRLRSAGCVFAEDEADLLITGAAGRAELATMLDRRIAGLPLEHVLGWAEFCGQRITVHPGVFVPRRRTEFLVSQARALVADGTVVVDLCCGSGAVGAALAAAATIELHAVDIDPAAVECARRNVANVHLGDLCTPLPTRLRGHIDVLVANAPYVPTDAIALMPAEARDHEPLVALDGGADGLAVQRRVAAQARQWLAPGGHLLIETSEQQSADTAAAFTEHGLRPRIARSDDIGATVAIGTNPA